MDVKIEPLPDYLYVRMSGDYQDSTPIEGHPDSVGRACREGNYRRLLVDIKELTGNMETLEAYHRGEDIARVFSHGDVHIAIVGSREHIRVLAFFENVIVNRGAILRVFADIDEATEWLTQL